MFSSIILAGGAGIRLQQQVPKQFLAIAGKPMIMHTLERLEKIDVTDEIVVVCLPKYQELLRMYIDAYMLKKKYIVVDSGESRQASTYNGLRASCNKNVMIHEAARPFVTRQEFQQLLDDPEENVIYGVNIPFTVSRMTGDHISGLFTRSELINVQLPQKFNRLAMLEAHERALADGAVFTEDSSVLYHYGTPIKVLQGTHYNIKITEPVDLLSSELIYKEYIVGRD